jgi:hypothetical protein
MPDMLLSHDPTALKAAIADAFAARAYPGDGDIGINTPNCEWYEGEVVARFFRGRDWRDLEFDHMLAAGPEGPLGSVPAFMTVSAFAYYLPGFLTMMLDVDPDDMSYRQDQLYTFATSVCFCLTAPAPNALAKQYDLIKNMPDVPDDVKESLRNPTPEAMRAQQCLVDSHNALVAMLTPAERAVITAVLDHIMPILDAPGISPELNDAKRALDTTWAAFRQAA